MKKQKGLSILLIGLSLVILICGLMTCNLFAPPEDPELVLERLVIHGEVVNLSTFTVTVPSDVDQVMMHDVQAFFKGHADVVVMVKNDPVELRLGEATTVTLEVPAKFGSYKAWTKEIFVIRKEDPVLELQSLTILGKTVDGDSVEVPYKIREIESKDVSATFNYGEITGETIDTYVIDGMIDEPWIITLLVLEEPGKYKEWRKEITVTREFLKLTSFKVFGNPVTVTDGEVTGAIHVPNTVTQLVRGDIVATFNYGENTHEEPFPYSVKSLEEGPNPITVTVFEDREKYGEWTRDITVIRGEDPVPDVQSITIHGETVSLTDNTVSVSYEKSTVGINDIAVAFTNVTIPPSSINITAPDTLVVGANTVTLSVEALNGSHVEWSKEITVIREEPELTLKSLMVFNTDLTTLDSIDVGYETSAITQENIVAKFSYGTVGEEQKTVSISKETLDVGDNTVKLSVDGRDGVYKAWSKTITVTREEPELVLNTLAVCTVPVTFNNGIPDPVRVDNAYSEVTPGNVNATFTYGTEMTPQSITITSVTGGDLSIIDGAGKTVTLSVAGVSGSYKSWSKDIIVIREVTEVTSVSRGDGILKTNAMFIPASGTIEGAGPGEGVTLPSDLEDTTTKGVFVAGRNVQLSSFAIAETEVTYTLWHEVYQWATGNDPDSQPATTYKFANVGSGSGTYPVTNISWRDAIVWCNAYTEKITGNTTQCVYRKGDDHTVVLKDATATYVDGGTTKNECDRAYFNQTKTGFRLPTEAEWEYAARYQSGTYNLCPLDRASGAIKPAPFKGVTLGGETWGSLRTVTELVCVFGYWWNGELWQGTEAQKAEVGSKDANALGLFDMSGNVREWCWDWYNENVTAGDGAADPVVDPAGADFGSGPAPGRVNRGGSYYNSVDMALVGWRNDISPYNAYGWLGFRVAW